MILRNNSRKNHINIIQNKFVGSYGGCYSTYYSLSNSYYKPQNGLICSAETNGENPFDDRWAKTNPYIPQNKKHWDKICTIDPYGMYGPRPTISGTRATMYLPELKSKLTSDGLIVTEDKGIKCIKIAVDQVWNIPMIADRLKIDESLFREELYKTYPDPNIKKENIFLPPIGGSTIYIIGDLDNYTELTVRVHDECTGSDVFGTDICTCRPYLINAIEEGALNAQKGGCGVIVYNRKEGRALGEVVKFLVYNSRATQEGGDRPETYFEQTKNIAGIVDARMQKLMPDILLWLGIQKIDVWMSMSNEKSSAIKEMGISIIEQKELDPEDIPQCAKVEIEAKIKSGYYSKA